jgi:hypothetical protein
MLDSEIDEILETTGSLIDLHAEGQMLFSQIVRDIYN